jgi:lipid-A-disaccharide synthase-like uncharacterized protein
MSDPRYPANKTRPRRWRLWSGRLLWLFALMFVVQNALASRAEYEPVAASIFWAFAILILFGGVIFEVLRSQNFKVTDSDSNGSDH